LKQSQLGKIPPVQREVENFALHYGLPETADGGLHHGRIRAHFYPLLFRTELEVHGDRRSLVYVQRDSLLQISLEAFRLNLQLIMPDRKLD